MKLLVTAIFVVQLISGLVVWYDLKSANVEPCKLPGAAKPKSSTSSSKRKIPAKSPQQMGSADTLEVTRR